MSSPEYEEGTGPENVTFTTGTPIIWTWNVEQGRWNEPRDMGWIPQLQDYLKAMREIERVKTQPDFDAWEAELG